MKVVIIGATGRCGGHATRACIESDRVTKIFLISRRAVPEEFATNPKCEVILHEDFSTWPEGLMKKLDGVEACLWAVGGRVSQMNNDKVYCRKVNVEFTLSFAKALATHTAPTLPPSVHFKFIFCSGSFSEWNPNATLLFLSDSRKIKGEIEKNLCEMADKDEKFDTWILQPMELQDEQTGWVRRAYMRPLGFGIETEEVGRVMARIAVGRCEKRVLENEDIIKMAKEL